MHATPCRKGNRTSRLRRASSPAATAATNRTDPQKANATWQHFKVPQGAPAPWVGEPPNRKPSRLLPNEPVTMPVTTPPPATSSNAARAGTGGRGAAPTRGATERSRVWHCNRDATLPGRSTSARVMRAIVSSKRPMNPISAVKPSAPPARTDDGTLAAQVSTTAVSAYASTNGGFQAFGGDVWTWIGQGQFDPVLIAGQIDIRQRGRAVPAAGIPVGMGICRMFSGM